jgi:hypothetical protein
VTNQILCPLAGKLDGPPTGGTPTQLTERGTNPNVPSMQPDRLRRPALGRPLPTDQMFIR